MHTFPSLETDRLVLRKPEITDVNSLIAYINNRNISRNLVSIPYPFKEENAVVWLNFIYQGFKARERYVFGIALKETNELIGAVGLHINGAHNQAELGYWIGEPFWGRGMMSEAVKEVIRFGFEECYLNKIFATCFTDNIGSEKVLINNGMIKEGELADHYRMGDVYRNVYQYRLTKAEYAGANSVAG